MTSKSSPKPETSWGSPHGDHADMVPNIRRCLAQNVLMGRRAPTRVWRMKRPGTYAYSYRVMWTPGVIVLTGDLGSMVYTGVTHFSRLWDAVELLEAIDFAYLNEKSTHKKAYDPEATAAALIRIADDQRLAALSMIEPEPGSDDEDDDHEDAGRPSAAPELSLDDPGLGLWRRLAAFVSRDDEDVRRDDVRASIARDLTVDRTVRVDAGDAYDLTDDYEMLVDTWPTDSRWHHEAIRHWARAVLQAEPAWHKRWRALCRWVERERDTVRRAWRGDMRFRPAVIRFGPAGRYGGGYGRWWIREDKIFRAVRPLRLLGLSLDRFGLWLMSGESRAVTQADDIVAAEAEQGLAREAMS